MSTLNTSSLPDIKDSEPTSKGLVLATDFDERDYLSEGYQPVQFHYTRTCIVCHTQFSTPTKPTGPQVCPACPLQTTTEEPVFQSGDGEEYFPYEADRMNPAAYIAFWHGRMDRPTFVILTLLAVMAWVALGQLSVSATLFVFLALQMVKRGHDLGRSRTHLIPLVVLFLLWLPTAFVGLGLPEKILFIIFTFQLAFDLIRLMTLSGTPGVNRFGPQPGLFKPIGGVQAAAPVGEKSSPLPEETESSDAIEPTESELETESQEPSVGESPPETPSDPDPDP
jgi:uncharacterized membrane protein YhaH (DUF805 family)